MSRSDYYRSEADRVQRMAEASEPGFGRESFERVAEEYRSLADRYEAGETLTPSPVH